MTERLEFTCAVCGWSGGMGDYGASRQREVVRSLVRGSQVTRVLEDLCAICVAREAAERACADTARAPQPGAKA